jgi:hypothetical protein
MRGEVSELERIVAKRGNKKGSEIFVCGAISRRHPELVEGLFGPPSLTALALDAHIETRAHTVM